MLFYRVKIEANGKPYMVKKHGDIETWSAIAAGELFTPNEVAKRGLDLNDLEAVEVNRNHTHYVGPYRLPDSDTSITPINMMASEPKKLSKEVADQVAKAAATRPFYSDGKRQNRGQLKIYRA